METLEAHSKSHLIKWVDAPGGSLITWQVKPIKKSINFGIFRHSQKSRSNGDALAAFAAQLPPGASINERLQSSGLEEVIWHGRCESGVLLNGSYGVKMQEGGMYAFVFDNTFSKTTAKTVLFSHQVQPPVGRNHSSSNLRRGSVSGQRGAHQSANGSHSQSQTSIAGQTNGSGSLNDSTASISTASRSRSGTAIAGNTNGNDSGVRPPINYLDSSGIVTTEITRLETNNPARQRPTWVSNDRYMTGVMLKKRRKKLQGYGRRYFSLDRKYALLNYYLDQKSSFLRGSMPINLCAITAIEASREIIIDSGMETWNLKAINSADWKAWTKELDTGVRKTKELRSARPSLALTDREATPDVSSLNQGAGSSGDVSDRRTSATLLRPLAPNVWATFDSLVNRLRDANSDAKRTLAELDAAVFVAPPVPKDEGPPQLQRRPSFWRRKSREKLARQKTGSSEDNEQPNSEPVSNTEYSSSKENLGDSSPGELNGHGQALIRGDSQNNLGNNLLLQQPLVRMHDILATLETLVGEFGALGKLREETLSTSAGNTRDSVISETDVFFDAAEDMDGGVLYLSGQEGVSTENSEEEVDEDDYETDEEGETPAQPKRHVANRSSIAHINKEFSTEPSSQETHLYPLPINTIVERRSNIRPAVCAPPSLIGLLRKNVGKDLSSVVMPVTCNEPITILQRFAEMMEYSELLDRAADSSLNECERAMLVATFAVSGIACQRCKERALRKPFNPLLGETYELVREDKGFRLIAEKVSHRPPIMAIQVESKQWSLHYTARPDQKYWGKSMELTDKGAVRIHFKETGDSFEYYQASMFLRNIIAGEKYLEPVGSLTVEGTKGSCAVVEYKQGGMFSGRSESLLIRATQSDGRAHGTRFEGKWTESIQNISSGETMWQAGKLVSDAIRKYGYTQWTVSLNEMTEIEKGQLPPTDSRNRPDQRKYEAGDIDDAEKLKLHLEEQQRVRRKVMETANKEHQPVFFRKEGDSYVLKDGDANYWARRKAGDWEGLIDMFKC